MTAPRRWHTQALVTAAVLLAIPACSSGGDNDPAASAAPPSRAPASSAPAATPTTKITTPMGGLPDPRTINHKDATAVSRAAVQVMWTVDSAIDRGQADAYRRALPYLTVQYAAQIRNDPGTESIPAPWRDHRAYAKVHLTPQQPESGAGPDTATIARRQWAITVTPTGRDGWKAAPVNAIAFVALTRPSAAAPWRVTSVTTA